MGLSGTGILRKIELPLALAPIFTGIRIAAVTVVATAPIAAIAGGGGLGDIIVEPGDLPLSGRSRRVFLRDGALGGSMDRVSGVGEMDNPEGRQGG